MGADASQPVDAMDGAALAAAFLAKLSACAIFFRQRSGAAPKPSPGTRAPAAGRRYAVCRTPRLNEAVKQSINRQDFKLKISQKNKVMMTLKNTPALDIS